MTATYKTKGTFEGAKRAIGVNGSPGSLKSSFSLVCVWIFSESKVKMAHADCVREDSLRGGVQSFGKIRYL